MERGCVHVQVDDIREIFRRVSPYVTRQWKELCKELDLHDSDLAAIENTGFEVALSQLAFKGMCLWYERSKGKASQEKLLHALRTCGLRRAEEEMKNINLRMLVVGSPSPRPTSSVSRPPSSRVSSARHKKTPVPKVLYQHASLSTRPISGRDRFIRSARSRSAKKKKSEVEDPFCEVCLKVLVRQIHLSHMSEFEGLIKLRQRNKEMVEKFYRTICENSDHYVSLLDSCMDIREVSVIKITPGSLVIHCHCRTLGALESLNQMYKSRRLLAIYKSVFVTDEMLNYVGANVLEIDVQLKEEDLDDCREILLSRRFRESATVHPTDMLPLPSSEDPQNDQKLTGDRKNEFDINKWRRHVSDEYNAIKLQYQKFSETMSEFLRTLQIILPQGREKIFCLSDVIGLFNYLTDSSGVSSGVRTDLVREFISIVNHIRLVVADIKQNSDLAFPDDEDGDNDDFRIMECLVNDIEEMLQPNTDFEEDISVLDRKIGPAEKPFTGLVCFVPLLLAKLSTVLYTLSAPL